MKKKLLVLSLLISLFLGGCTSSQNINRSMNYNKAISIKSNEKVLILQVSDSRLERRLEEALYYKGWNVLVDNKGIYSARYQMNVIVEYNEFNEYWGSTVKLYDLNTRRIIYTQNLRAGLGFDSTFFDKHSIEIVNEFVKTFQYY